MRARRVDRNHAELREKCEGFGISWLPIAPEHGGEPDALLGCRGQSELVEVKPPLGPRGGKSGRELRPEQVEWHAQWRGSSVKVVRAFDDICALFGITLSRD